MTLDVRCRLAFLVGVRDYEERSEGLLTGEELRRTLAHYPDVKDPSWWQREAWRFDRR